MVTTKECPLCHKHFINTTYLYRHIQRIHKHAPLNDKLGGNRRSTSSKFSAEAQETSFESSSAAKKRPVSETNGKKKENSPKELMTSSKSGINMKCKICRKDFRNLHELNGHIRVVHKKGYGGARVCEICRTVFRNTFTLNRHMRQVHTKETDGLTNECKICHKSFHDAYTLRKHIMTDHKKTATVQCPSCDKCFLNQKYLRRHIRRCHNHLYQKKSAVKECPICHKTFSCSTSTKRHMNWIHKQEISNWISGENGSLMRSTGIITDNALTYQNNNMKPSFGKECETCHKLFRDSFHLKKHVCKIRIRQTDGKPKESNVCHKVRYGGVVLLEPIKIDVNKRPVCGKRFPHSSSLRRHFRYVHNLEASIENLACNPNPPRSYVEANDNCFRTQRGGFDENAISSCVADSRPASDIADTTNENFVSTEGEVIKLHECDGVGSPSNAERPFTETADMSNATTLRNDEDSVEVDEANTVTSSATDDIPDSVAADIANAKFLINNEDVIQINEANTFSSSSTDGRHISESAYVTNAILASDEDAHQADEDALQAIEADAVRSSEAVDRDDSETVDKADLISATRCNENLPEINSVISPAIHCRRVSKSAIKRKKKLSKKCARGAKPVIGKECKICERFFRDSFRLNHHIAMVHKNKSDGSRKECNICHKSLHDAYTLQRHVLIEHTKIGIRKCPGCDKNYIDLYSLRQHARVVHNKELKDFKNECPICHKLFQNPSKVKIHIEWDHYQEPSNENSDGNNNSSRSNASLRKNSTNKQINAFNSKIGYECEICHMVFRHACLLKRHTHVVHEKGIDGLRKECDICHKTFDVAYTLRRHILIDHRKTHTKECPYCEKNFLLEQHLRTHIRRYHSNFYTRRMSSKECPICYKRFKLPVKVRRHMRSVHHVEPSNEDLVGNQSKSRSNGNSTNNDEQELEVNGTSAKSSTPIDATSASETTDIANTNYLDKQLPILKSSSGKECHICKKILHDKYTLRRHILHDHRKTHTIECPFCDKNYVDMFALRPHVWAVHKTTLPVVRNKCHICNRNFRYPARLRQHIERVHDQETSSENLESSKKNSEAANAIDDIPCSDTTGVENENSCKNRLSKPSKFTDSSFICACDNTHHSKKEYLLHLFMFHLETYKVKRAELFPNSYS